MDSPFNGHATSPVERLELLVAAYRKDRAHYAELLKQYATEAEEFILEDWRRSIAAGEKRLVELEAELRTLSPPAELVTPESSTSSV